MGMGSVLPPPSAPLAPGDRLDRYELICVLAQGGMGTVWLARLSGKLNFERLVAVKLWASLTLGTVSATLDELKVDGAPPRA